MLIFYAFKVPDKVELSKKKKFFFFSEIPVIPDLEEEEKEDLTQKIAYAPKYVPWFFSDPSAYCKISVFWDRHVRPNSADSSQTTD